MDDQSNVQEAEKFADVSELDTVSEQIKEQESAAKDDAMPLTRNFRDTVRARAERRRVVGGCRYRRREEFLGRDLRQG